MAARRALLGNGARLYYKLVGGVTMDGPLLEACAVAVQGKGDGRVSEADAKLLLAKVLDGQGVTAVERVTCAHILDEFKWTDNARRYFVRELLRAKHIE